MKLNEIIAKWKAEGRRLTQPVIAIACAIAAQLILHPRDGAWGRKMLAKRGGLASVQSPRHFPIQQARAIRERNARIRRTRREEQAALKRTPFALPRQKPHRYLPL
jgi:hypothetical protein